jgi:hypothetical protein
MRFSTVPNNDHPVLKFGVMELSTRKLVAAFDSEEPALAYSAHLNGPDHADKYVQSSTEKLVEDEAQISQSAQVTKISAAALAAVSGNQSSPKNSV